MLYVSCLLLFAVQTPTPNPYNREAWTAHILLNAEEARHELAGWIPQFGAGLLAASEQRKPLLLWAMNGHPLGCT